MEHEEIKKSCFDLHNKFKDGGSCDINGRELYEKLIYHKRSKTVRRTTKIQFI